MGSNLPDGPDKLAQAARRIAALADGELLLSTLLLTEPVDFPWPCRFANQVAYCRTSLRRESVVSALKDIEREAGRRAADKALGIVRLDLDLLSYDGRVLRPTDWQRSYVRRAVDELSLQLSKRASSPTLSSTSSASPEST